MGERLAAIGTQVAIWLVAAVVGFFGLVMWGGMWLIVILACLDLFGVIHIDTDEAKPTHAVERSVRPTCDPNYTGCVPDSPYDVDCDEVAGPVEVIGSDVDGLDADNDGIGCEWG